MFNTLEHDFGAVTADQGTLYYEFKLKNLGSETVRIGTLYPSCSCLYINMDDKTLDPGEEGVIGVTMGLSGYSGRMFRTVDVYTVDEKHLGTLNLWADITPPQREIEFYYPIFLSESLLCNRDNINFGYLYWSNSTELSLGIANTSEKTLTLDARVLGIGNPSLSYPRSIGPGEKAEIVVRYTALEGSYLACHDELLISIDGKPAAKNIALKCIIMNQLEKTADSPSLWSNPSFAPFKLRAKTYKGSVELGNSGNSELIVYEVFTSTKTNITKGTKIAPGKSIKVNASSKEPKAKIELFTNDPVRPYKELIFNY